MSKAIGCDPGTMNFQVAEMTDDKSISFKTIRNAFVELAEADDIEEVLKQNKWYYLKDGGKYYVIGEDALKVAQMFPGKVELRRPMQEGVLNKGEEKKILILSQLIENAIGKALDSNSVVCTCVSSPSVDGSVDSRFHQERLKGMFVRLGWNVKVIEEGLAVVLSERPTITETDGTESPFSGLGSSWGAGRTNCVLAYKGLQIIGVSCGRGGDWIDKMVSEATDVPIAQVIAKKEKRLDFTNLDLDDDVILALDTYYTSLIEFVFAKFAKKFSEVKSQFDAPLDIIVAGGTSMPKGFDTKLREVVKGLHLPFKIKDIKMSSDPRNSVVKGCLAQSIITQSKLTKGTQDKELNQILGS